MTNNDQIMQIVTDKIIKILESGHALNWVKGWADSNIKNFDTKKAYNGVNAMILYSNMLFNGYKSPYYLTFKQCQKLKGHIKAGSKCEIVIFCDVQKYNKIVCSNCSLIKDRCKCSNYIEKDRTFARFIYKTYNVFNIEQTDLKAPEEQKKTFNSIEECEKIIKNFKDSPIIRINTLMNDQRAYYSPSEDLVNMPVKTSFDSEKRFYSVLFHELIHSTGHEKRLKREGIIEHSSYFGSTTYSKEELIAELGAAFLRSLCGIESENELINSSAYLNGWLQNMREDKKFIFNVVGSSKKAVSYILGEVKT